MEQQGHLCAPDDRPQRCSWQFVQHYVRTLPCWPDCHLPDVRYWQFVLELLPGLQPVSHRRLRPRVLDAIQQTLGNQIDHTKDAQLYYD
jgi:hypothetical protein